MREVRYVEWLDSTGMHGWRDLKENVSLEPDHCMTVGFVIKETDDYLTLLQSHTARKDGDLDSGDNSICIPKFAITNSILMNGPEVA